MDLKAYYRKIREAEATIATPFVVVCSLDTPDGGKAGQLTETTKPVAARLIAEGRSRLATDAETEEFHLQLQAAREEAEATAAAQRMQVIVMPQTDRRPKPGKN